MHPWRTLIPVLLTLLLALSGCSDDDNPDGSGGSSGTGGSGGSSGTGGTGNTGGDEPGEPISIQVISNGDVLAAVGAPEDFLANPIPDCTRMDNSSAGTTDVSFTCPDPGAGDYRVPVTAAGAVQVALRVEGEAQDSRSLGIGEGAFLEFTLPLMAPECVDFGDCDGFQVCVESECVPGTFVFISSTTSTGDLGGVTGADDTCETLATAAGLTFGAVFAWTASSEFEPADFAGQTIPYYRVDGVKVADDWADLTDGSLDNPINVDESGNATSSAAVWTHTDIDGTWWGDGNEGSGCTGFTSGQSTETSVLGNPGRSDASWTVSGFSACGSPRPVYCFEAGPL
jgi:hypothetical protein